MSYFGLQRENEIEAWLRPHCCPIRMPGYKVRQFESTQLFHHLYWKLQLDGYTEQQIADFALSWGYLTQTPPEIAMVLAVFDLAERRGLEVWRPGRPCLEA